MDFDRNSMTVPVQSSDYTNSWYFCPHIRQMAGTAYLK